MWNRILPTKKIVGKKLFRSVLATYLLLMIVTLLLLGGGYSYSIQQARQDIETLQISFLKQVRRELDIRLNSVSQVSNFLATYPLTQSVSKHKDEKIDYLWDYRLLDEIIMEKNTLLNGVGKTIVYFDASDSVLTGEYRYRSINMEAFTIQLGLTPEEFRDFLPDKVTKGELGILHPNTPEAELVYMIPIIDSSVKKVGTVMTRFSMKYLQDSINTDHWWDGSICHMQNDSEYLYIDDSGKGDVVFGVDLPQYDTVPLDASPVKMVINGEKYLTVGLLSADNNLKYFFSVPLKEFTSGNVVYIALFIVVLCLSLFTGIMMSLYFSQRFSHPIQEIMDSLKIDSAVNYPKAVSSLKESLLTYRKESAITQNQAARILRQRRAGFVYGLCTGRVSPERLSEGKKEFSFPLEEGPVALIIFKYRVVEGSAFIKDGFLDQEMMLYAGVNVVEELLCQGSGVAVIHEKEIICLYQPKSIPTVDELQDALKEIYKFHKEILNVGLHIFCSDQGESLSDLPELLSMTEEMSRYKMFWGSDVPDILFINDISDMSDINEPFTLGVEKRFFNLMAIESYEEAYKMLMDQLNSRISKDFKRFQQDKYKIHGFISELIENIHAYVPEKDKEKFDAILNGLLTEQSFSNLRESVTTLFQYLIKAQQEKSNVVGIPSWVQEAQEYIDNNYNDPQMDVSHLAKVFSLNISYLSRTYKKVTSIGVLDNIHMVRIAKAKALLDKGSTVLETSLQVGYMESRALIRAFKRYEGITPGQYQEAVLKAKK